MGHIDTSSEPQMEWPYSVVITLPPLAGIILSLESARGLAVLTDEARE
jgi:1,4-alpha-glucan branching enzyme